MRSFSFLVNPVSGGGAAPEALVPVARALREAGARVEVTHTVTAAEVHAPVAAAAEHGDVVVPVGGDGMLSSVVGAAAETGATLGIVPAGRGNDFARSLRIPDDPAARARLLLEGPARPTDLLLWSLGGEQGRSATVAGSVYCGVDARASAIVDRVRWMPGRLQYPWAAVVSLATYSPGDFRVVVDQEGYDFAAATVVVANSGFYGQGMHIAPEADVHDGRLDVVVIEATSRWELVRALPTVYDGAHVTRPEVTVLRGQRVELGCDPAGVPVGADGEQQLHLPRRSEEPLVVEVLPGAVPVIVGADPAAGAAPDR